MPSDSAVQTTNSPSAWVADHTERYLATDGKDGHEWRPGVPTLLLTVTGRRTGIRRRTALIYGRDGDRYVVVASKGGDAHHPTWYLNLVADPEVDVQVGSEVTSMTASTATGAERERLWADLARIWPDYENYAARTDRVIPVVVLSPRG